MLNWQEIVDQGLDGMSDVELVGRLSVQTAQPMGNAEAREFLREQGLWFQAGPAAMAGVMAEVESQLIQPTNTPVPPLNMNEITAEVVQAVGPRIEDRLIDLYQRANPAVVFIIVPFVGSGSGFVYSADGYIVTNSHVVADATDFEVVFWNGDRLRAELVGTDVDSDLAVIKVDDLPTGVEPLPLAD